MCHADEARNSFAIPLIESHIRSVLPHRILDIGCGTGYISRSVLRAGVGQGSEWLLLDRNPDFLNYAQRMLAEVHNVDFLRSDIRSVSNYSGALNDLAFICYSLLETRELELFIQGMNKLLSEDADVILIYPDVIEDIEATNDGNNNLLGHYRLGLCAIEKLNRLTGEKEEFFAHRVEAIIQSFCELNFCLFDMRAYLTQNQKRHFGFVFRRSGSTVEKC